MSSVSIMILISTADHSEPPYAKPVSLVYACARSNASSMIASGFINSRACIPPTIRIPRRFVPPPERRRKALMGQPPIELFKVTRVQRSGLVLTSESMASSSCAIVRYIEVSRFDKRLRARFGLEGTYPLVEPALKLLVGRDQCRIEWFISLGPVETNFQAPLEQSYQILDGYEGANSTLGVRNPINVEIIGPIFRLRITSGIDRRLEPHLEQRCASVLTLLRIGFL